MGRAGTFAGAARDVSICDFRVPMRAESVLVDRRGHRYLVYARSPIERIDVADRGTGELGRTMTHCALVIFFVGFLATAVWFGFFAPGFGTPALASSAALAKSQLEAETHSGISPGSRL
ncbi:MAG TPA: hypothetical protein VGN14_13710 [Candidatus Elarobacter sp.]